MEQAGSYGGGGNFVPLGHSSAATIDSLALDVGGLNHYRDFPPREPSPLPHASAPSEGFYNPNSTYASAQPSVPSYSPRVPSYEDYTTSTSNAASYANAGGYNDGLQSLGSAGLPTSAAYQQVGYDQQVGYNQFAYERPGYGLQGNRTTSYEGRGYEGNGYGSVGDDGRVASSGFATSYGDGGCDEVHVYDGGSRSDAASFGGLAATPKVDESDDTSGGILKYRVKMLPDMSSSTSKDVVFQIGLDGVRMVDPGTGRILRFYPLDTITRWEVNEPSVFTFWAKSAVDIEERSIRLQSSAYTTNSILDTITAACVQWCEMGGKDGPDKDMAGDNAKSGVPAVQPKTSIVDWVSTIRPRVPSEDKYHWVPDEDVGKCKDCHVAFSTFNRKHHCRNCGDIYCDNCTKGRTALTAEEGTQGVRVCDRCLAEVTQRLTNAKDTTKVTVSVSHEDLAKKLQEELERNARRKESEKKEMRMKNTTNSITQVSGKPTSKGCGSRMQEVACPTCTVHLQVQVPSHGTETVECEVCQQLFLVAA